MLDGQLAMALGKDALEQRIDQVLDPLRFRRKDHKKLLLAIALHPPSSDQQ